MNKLISFFVSGWEHIVDINAYDHLLFIMTLCAAFKLKEWKQLLVIVTAFTVGHSLTLILCALDYVPPNSTVVEALIPFTIMITALANVIDYKNAAQFFDIKFKYGIALIFGLVHGLAFASGFKFMMFGDSILLPLFSFNVGIELGQLLIVLIFMATLWVFTNIVKGEHSKWNLFVSGAGFGIAATLFLNSLNG